MIGMCSVINGRYSVAIAHGREALDIATAVGDRELAARSTYLMAVSHLALGEYPPAIDGLTRLVEGPEADLARRLAGLFGSLYEGACCWLAFCWAERGEFARASACADRAIEAVDAADVPQAQALAYNFRACVHLLKGEFAQALPWVERAVRLCETRGLLALLWMASNTHGWVLAWSGRRAEALQVLERIITFQEGTERKFFVPLTYAGAAEAFLLSGRPKEARRAADRALELALETGERPRQAVTLRVLGDIAATQEPPDEGAAAAFLERARALAEVLGMRPLFALCRLSLGRLRLRTGQRAEAEEDLRAARAMFSEMDMRFWLEQAEQTWREIRSL